MRCRAAACLRSEAPDASTNVTVLVQDFQRVTIMLLREIPEFGVEGCTRVFSRVRWSRSESGL